ncbi:MAG: recombinase family protein [Actinomycetota bacterium]|nr:recombinase family protein [Actinomycetota bacterium]
MAAPFTPDPGPGHRGDGNSLVLWAERTARGDIRAPGRGTLRFVFYGRVSTEDWQDPVTSRARQREQAEMLVRGHGVIVAELFDVGESRTVAWPRRPQAGALVAQLADPDRGWDPIVIGEYERAFYGSQYAAMAPLFEHYGVQLWMPETGGRVDYKSEHDEKTMTGLGLSSKREITRTSIRVRTAMAVQTREQGRYLGGRPPYGYRLADAGPHPNKAHAAWGRRAHRLDPEPRTAPTVRWIFAQRLAGHSVARIARALNEAGVPCPSAADPHRNTHRSGTAWTLGTVTTILENPRYTGRQVWNRQRTDTELVDPANVTLGHRAVPRRNLPDGWVISSRPAHPALVSEADFIAAQDVNASRGPLPRDKPVVRRYLLAGLLACGVCGRRMESAWSNGKPAYRCRHGRTSAMAPDPSLPKNTYIREDKLLPHLPALHLLLTTPAVRARRRTRAGADVKSTVSPGEVIGHLRKHEITLTWNPAAAALQARATQIAKTITLKTN